MIPAVSVAAAGIALLFDVGHFAAAGHLAVSADGTDLWVGYGNGNAPDGSDGKSSNVGASSYILKTGDKVEWKLSTISSFSN